MKYQGKLLVETFKTEGRILQLKSRLFKYLKGKPEPDFFQNPEDLNISTDTIITTKRENSEHKMADKKSYFKPGIFSENISNFLK